MKAACLLLVLLVAKVLTLAGRPLPASMWTPVVFLWQDVLVALVFAILDALLFRRQWVGWTCYAVIAVYTALNVAVVHTLSTPLTVPVLQAAAGPLADSIRHHVDFPNVLRMAIVLIVAGMGPAGLRRFQARPAPRLVWPVALATVGLGWVGTARIDTAGLHRNALLAFWPVALPPTADTSFADWRARPFPKGTGEDLSRFRASAAGRNVLLIVLESTGAEYLKPWGATENPTPNLTRLAEHSIRFARAYCAYPESVKGFFSVLCSRFPAFGIDAEHYAAVRTPSLAGELAAAGYRTALFHSGRFMYLGMAEMIQDRGFDTLEDAGAISGQPQSSFGVDEPATVARILEWMDQLAPGERFLVAYLPIAGHHPYNSPAGGPFPERTEVDRYRNALYAGDRALGQLLAGLEDRGLATNTLVVVFGDHGEAFGDHEGNYGHTLFLYEANVRVPLLVAAPGVITAPRIAKRTASLIDVAPTVLDLLGLNIPEQFQGSSLLAGPEEMALFFTDYSLGLLGLRDGRWKCIHELNSGRSRLFDLESDPAERHNLAAEHPDRVRAYRDRLLAWASAQRDLVQAQIRFFRP